MAELTKALCKVFLSTPSARRATEVDRKHRHREKISIHALREEGDGYGNVLSISRSGFLSTPSARRATSASTMRWTR